MRELEFLSDVDWFDTMSEILSKDKCPTTHQLAQSIGIEDSRFSWENRGSNILIPFDKRFKTVCINPDLSDDEIDKPIDYLSFGGVDFNLKIADIIQRFPDYKTNRNTYDGGTQLFFHPLAEKFEFSALSVRYEKEPEDIGDINSIIFHHIAFHFCGKVKVGRDGYHVRR